MHPADFLDTRETVEETPLDPSELDTLDIEDTTPLLEPETVEEEEEEEEVED